MNKIFTYFIIWSIAKSINILIIMRLLATLISLSNLVAKVCIKIA